MASCNNGPSINFQRFHISFFGIICFFILFVLILFICVWITSAHDWPWKERSLNATKNPVESFLNITQTCRQCWHVSLHLVSNKLDTYGDLIVHTNQYVHDPPGLSAPNLMARDVVAWFVVDFWSPSDLLPGTLPLTRISLHIHSISSIGNTINHHFNHWIHISIGNPIRFHLKRYGLSVRVQESVSISLINYVPPPMPRNKLFCPRDANRNCFVLPMNVIQSIPS